MGLPVRFVDHTTAWASSARVARIDDDYRNARHLRLVGDEAAKLGERPPMQTVALALSGPNPLTNAGQFLDRNGKAVAFSRGNDLLRYAVTRVFPEPGLLPGEFLQAPLGCRGASGLKPATTLGKLLADALDLGARVGPPLAVKGKVHHTEVDTEDPLDIDLCWVWNVANAGKEPLALNEHQVNLALAVSEKSALSISANKWDLLAPADCPNAHDIWHNPDDSVVVWLSRVLAEDDDLRIAPVGFLGGVSGCHFVDATDGNLGRNPKFGAGFGVGEFVQVELTDDASVKARFGQKVARLVASLQRASEQVSLILRRLELNVGDQLHDSSIERNVRACPLVL